MRGFGTRIGGYIWIGCIREVGDRKDGEALSDIGSSGRVEGGEKRVAIGGAKIDQKNIARTLQHQQENSKCRRIAITIIYHFSRERLRRILRKQLSAELRFIYIFTSAHLHSHLYLYSSSHLHSHLHIYISAHLHILTSTSLLIFPSSHLYLTSSPLALLYFLS